jgi:hypothetical protein
MITRGGGVSNHCNPVVDPRFQLKRIQRTANFMATAHSWLRDFYGTSNLVLTLLALIGTASLLPLILTSDKFATDNFGLSPDRFKMLTAAVALASFIIVLIQMSWRPGALAEAHGHAVQHFTRAKYEARRLAESDSITIGDVRAIEEQYLDERDLPPIGERWFLPLKKWNNRKIALSKELDKNPEINLRKHKILPKE